MTPLETKVFYEEMTKLIYLIDLIKHAVCFQPRAYLFNIHLYTSDAGVVLDRCTKNGLDGCKQIRSWSMINDDKPISAFEGYFT